LKAPVENLDRSVSLKAIGRLNIGQTFLKPMIQTGNLIPGSKIALDSKGFTG